MYDSDCARVSFVSEKSRIQNSASQKQKNLEQTMIQKVLVRHDTLINTKKIKKTEIHHKYFLTSQYFALIEMLYE